MAKDHARVNVDVWADPDFRQLPAAAQHLYLMLWTSPGLSYCGVHDWRPGRFAVRAAGLNADNVRTIADCLEARHFTVTDDETEEILIRSWIRFDGLMKQPRMAISCIKAYAEVASNDLRGVIVHELHKLRSLEPNLSAWDEPRVQKVLENPSVDPKVHQSVTDPFTDGFTHNFTPNFTPSFAETQGKVSPSVCTPPTPAPTPTPYSITPSAPLPTNSPSSSNDSTASRSSGESKKPKEEQTDRFDEFWATYDKKRGKAKSRTQWAKIIKTTDPQVIIDAARTYTDTLKARGDHPQYTKDPLTWLNGQHWEDEIESTAQADNPHAHLLNVDDMPPLPNKDTA